MGHDHQDPPDVGHERSLCVKLCCCGDHSTTRASRLRSAAPRGAVHWARSRARLETVEGGRGRRGHSREGIRWNRFSSRAGPDSSARTSCGSCSRARTRASSCSTASPTPATWRAWPTSRHTRASRSSRATSPIARRSRRCCESTARTRWSNLAAETHVDRSIDGPRAFVETNVVGTFELLEAARRHLEDARARAPGALPVPPRLDRRGVRLARPDGPVRGDEPVRPELAVRGVEGGRRPPRAGLPRDVRPAGARHELLEQLRALPVPGEADPAHDPQRGGGPAAAALRRRGERARLAPRGGSLRGAAPGPAARGSRAPATTSGAGDERTNLEIVDAICAALESIRPAAEQPRAPRAGNRPLRRPPDVRRRPPGSRPSLRGRRDAGPDRARLAAGPPAGGRSPRHRRLVPRAPRLVRRRCSATSTGASASVWARSGPPAS